MMNKLPISVFIIAKDEEDRIPIAIKSVRNWVDEVIVIDSGSRDGTVAISEALGAKVFFRNWTGYGEQKVFGESLCQNKWILNIDADEEISPQLAEEIRLIFTEGPKHKAYTVRFYPVFPYQKSVSKWAHHNKAIRLYHRDHAGFSNHPVHDSVLLTTGSLGHFKGPVLHRSFRSLAHYIEKLNSYTSLQATTLFYEERKVNPVSLLLVFPLAFLKSYFLRRHFLSGLDGFTNSIMYAFFRYVRLAKLREQYAKRTLPGSK